MAVNARALTEATTALQMPPEYCRDAIVEVRHDSFVSVNRTCFYPNLSGQPCDLGELARSSDGRVFPVTKVEFDGDLIWHKIEGPEALEVGERISCRVDRSRRLFFSRLHSAAVLVSGIAHNRWGNCFVTSCGLFETHAKLDFSGGPKNHDEASALLAEANEVIAQDGDITERLIEIKEARQHREFLRSRALQDDFEIMDDEVRVVRIKSQGRVVEEQFDLGTHVARLREIGVLMPGTKDHGSISDNKGQNHFRLRFFLAL